MTATAKREFLRLWTQGLIYNYSNANSLGMHEVIDVTEMEEDGEEYTLVTIRTRYAMTVIDTENGKPYKTQVAKFHIHVDCDTKEIEDDLST